MNILDKVNSSADVKKLKSKELQVLCDEIRQYLVSNVSRTGGHIASNLGVVELSVAIHRVYDSQKDRIVFDVGHQSYTHKILTGRKDRFSTLRTFNGISGFTRPCEALDDAFISGHSSDSVSVALGMARARSFTKEDYDVVAVIGDGALTGGLAYEGFLNTAASNEPIVIILNDNKMSISKNVGGVSKYLQELRMKPKYTDFKRKYRKIMLHFPKLYHFCHLIKEKIKGKLIPGNFFSEIGMFYIGPMDGHDVKALENTLLLAKNLRLPVLVHILTTKGKGVEYTEAHPELYHGIGPFNPVTGEIISDSYGFSDSFGDYICTEAKNNSRLAIITAAMTDGTGIKHFSEEFPKQYFDVGIAEQHAVSFAAGLAKQGVLPVFAVYSSFFQRCYDMLIHDVSLLKLHVVFAVDRAGVNGRDGETHQGVFDLSFLTTVPGMTVLCPASYSELHEMMNFALYECAGPVAVRYPKGEEGEYKDCRLDEYVLREGNNVTLVTYGIFINNAMKAADLLAKSGIEAEVIKLGQVFPCSFDMAINSVKKTGVFVSLEDVCNEGCCGIRILAKCAESGIKVKSSALLNWGDGIIPQGSPAELQKEYGLDHNSIACRISELIRGDIS